MEKKVFSTEKMDRYEIWLGSRVVRITHDKEFGTVVATTWVNNGEIICNERFEGKTLGGARRFAKKWLGQN